MVLFLLNSIQKFLLQTKGQHSYDARTSYEKEATSNPKGKKIIEKIEVEGRELGLYKYFYKTSFFINQGEVPKSRDLTCLSLVFTVKKIRISPQKSTLRNISSLRSFYTQVGYMHVRNMTKLVKNQIENIRRTSFTSAGSSISQEGSFLINF